MPLHIPAFYVWRRPGLRAWWRRLRCRLWYGEHQFKGTPTHLYYVKCQHCDDQYTKGWPPPVPPMRDEVAQECPHCHNIAYGGNGKPFRCHSCHKFSQDGEGRVLAFPG